MSSGRRLRSLVALLLLVCSGVASASPAHVLAADGLGKGSVVLDGSWQFHLGDNPDWAAPGISDATGQNGWEQLTANEPWGAQGHRSYVGYAWYRRHLSLAPSPGAAPEFSLLIPRIEDAYEVYWNGKLVGTNGRLPPHPTYLYSQAPQIFNLGPARDGVLAVRVWKAPLTSFDTGLQGGFLFAPRLGSHDAIADYKTSTDYRWLHSRQYMFGLLSLYFLVMFLSLLAWSRDRSQRLFLWMALYALGPLLIQILIGFRLPWSYSLALGLIQPVNGLQDISLWFLLLYLLRLTEERFLVRLTTVLAFVDLTSNLLDGAITMLDWSNPLVAYWVQLADGILTVFSTVPQLLSLVLVGYGIYYGIRNRLDSARWIVAIAALCSSLVAQVRIAFQQGSRYTHWSFGAKLDAPLFFVNGNPFSVRTIANSALLLAIIYAVYRYLQETTQRQSMIEQEFRSAQELQQVLIPEELPSLPGYAVTSAYRPAQEVGGDFFQVIPALQAGSNLVVLGDVSGKGLKAAMAVSLIVGAIRTVADFTTEPAEILAGLNRRLYGRMQGGFATCVVLRIDEDGSCVMASAGHPAPFLNEGEIDLPGALPLGLVADAWYEETTVHLKTGDHFVLYTDGLLEARTVTGELFSFERLRELVAGRPTALQATEVAQNFGQEDDITVLTLTRLAAGVESRTELIAPVLVPA